MFVQKSTALAAFGHSDTFTATRAPGVREFTLGVDGKTSTLTLAHDAPGVRTLGLRIGGRFYGIALGKRRFA